MEPLTGLLLKNSMAGAAGVSQAKYLPDQNTCEKRVIGGDIQGKDLYWLLLTRLIVQVWEIKNQKKQKP